MFSLPKPLRSSERVGRKMISFLVMVKVTNFPIGLKIFLEVFLSLQ